MPEMTAAEALKSILCVPSYARSKRFGEPSDDMLVADFARALRAIGFAIVPVEATAAMLEAGDSVPGGPGFCDEPGDPPSAYAIWAAMLAAAIVAPGAEKGKTWHRY